MRIAVAARTGAVLFTLLISSATVAQPVPSKSPSSTHIFPAGARRGTTVDVRIGGECLPPGMRFHLVGQGVTTPTTHLMKKLLSNGESSPRRDPTEVPVSYPQDWAGRIEVASDSPDDVVYWHLSCSQAGTPSRPFVIGDLPEFIERESNSTARLAEKVKLPVTVNGRISGERDVDYFAVELKSGQVLSCETVAGRIGSRLDPVIQLIGPDGRPCQTQSVFIGSDPVLVYRARAGGRHLIRVGNVTKAGDAAHVYRLNLTSKPFLYSCFPRSGQTGATAKVSLQVLDGVAVRSIEREMKFPKGRRKFRLSDDRFSGTVTVPLTAEPNVVEREPNNQRTKAQELAIGSSVSGRFGEQTDQDWFAVQATKGQWLEIELEAAGGTSQAIPTIQLLSVNGKPIVNRERVDLIARKWRKRWQVPESGRYLIGLRDLRFGADGGRRHAFQLSVRESKPDFALTAKSDLLNAVRGSDASMTIEVDRFSGFSGPIELVAKGLPNGVKVENMTIGQGQTQFQVKFKIGPKVMSQLYSVRLVGTAKINGKKVTRSVALRHAGVDSEGISLVSPDRNNLGLAVIYKPLFRLYCSEAYLYAHRGSIFPYQMEIERLNGFDGDVTLELSDRQNRDLDGIEMLNVTIRKGQTQGILPIYLPETMHINIQSQSQLYSQAFTSFVDEHGQKQYGLVVAEKRNMLRTLPPVAKLHAKQKTITAKPGETVHVDLHLKRTSNYLTPLEVMLRQEPGDAKPSGLAIEAVRFDTGQKDLRLPIRVSKSARRNTTHLLTLRGHGPLPSDNSVIVITEVQVRVQVR